MSVFSQNMKKHVADMLMLSVFVVYFQEELQNITAITLTDSLCVQRTARQRGEYYDDTLHTAAARLMI